MKIAIFAFLMVVVLTLVEGWWGGKGKGNGGYQGETTTVDWMRLKWDKNTLVKRDHGYGDRRYIRDVNKKHHVHMSNERVPAARVARNAETLKNVHERMFAVAEDAGK
jgi:hypothetical protein